MKEPWEEIQQDFLVEFLEKKSVGIHRLTLVRISAEASVEVSC